MHRGSPLADFVETVSADAALRALLVAERHHERFAELCVAQGARRGLAFTADEVRQWQQRTNLAWLQRNLW